ncbi:MAG: type VI secretion system accessory protein TagJ [Pirellulales bacterium]|jgi:type VI secretion system protein ImpE|nr:type VI secretion system accessory protein TagJ [Thermoguttaceae bacterium]MDD4788139.1 type VI secretion system accessory protein TagJ [Pirellulales bacterium]MDI9442766.1 type VI secretion system accessory protein TagJ [Planctomycetota bacterium]NLZ01335.1 tetratricopeptide repeat protein [Pirellulaceae bacterium]
MNPSELFQAGRLGEAIAAATDQVKRSPADGGRRGLLAELLCFAGALEKADRQLDALSELDPQSALGVAMFRQLIRAEQARLQFCTEGRVPELLDKPDERVELHLAASIRIREGQQGEAAALLAQAEQLRPRSRGVSESRPFDDIRDLDDLTASFFEVYTTNGKYYWIPMERVERIEFRPPVRPRDLLWRRAHMAVAGGPDGEVYLPALYVGTHAAAEDQLRLGRSTDWRQPGEGPVRGVGQKMFLLGEETRGILAINELCFSTPAVAQENG